MKLLSIDTTSMRGSVALSEGADLVAQEQQGVPGTQAERLMGTIEHLLGVAGWNRTDIEGIAVAIGPGSFTGLRIGLGAAKGMALALRIPIAGVSSLASLALNAPAVSGSVVPLIDARRGELYAAAFTPLLSGGLVERLGECVLPPDVLIEKLATVEGDLFLVGDGTIAYGDQLTKGLGTRAHILSGSALLPQAVNLAILAHERLSRGQGDDLAGLIPNYIRHSDAEIGFKGRDS